MDQTAETLTYGVRKFRTQEFILGLIKACGMLISPHQTLEKKR